MACEAAAHAGRASAWHGTELRREKKSKNWAIVL